MNKENVAKLITALRSGKYGQATGKLTDGRNYCCLGVACDISGLGKWKYKGHDKNYVIEDDNGVEIENNDTVLPLTVARWLGIAPDGSLHLPFYENGLDIRFGTPEEEYLTDTLTALTDLNDTGLTFAQIADILENADTFEWIEPKAEVPPKDDVDDNVLGGIF